MFQQDALLPWKTVRDNVALGLMLAGRRARRGATRAPTVAGARRPRRVRDALSVAAERRDAQARRDGAELDHRPRDRADGRAVQRARRAHAAADGNASCSRCGSRVRSRKTVIFVTHDLEEAIALADEVVVLSAGPASRVVARHAVTLERPRDLLELRTAPAFVDLYRSIWAVLREEVVRSQRALRPRDASVASLRVAASRPSAAIALHRRCGRALVAAGAARSVLRQPADRPSRSGSRRGSHRHAVAPSLRRRSKSRCWA